MCPKYTTKMHIHFGMASVVAQYSVTYQKTCLYNIFEYLTTLGSSKCLKKNKRQSKRSLKELDVGKICL